MALGLLASCVGADGPQQKPNSTKPSSDVPKVLEISVGTTFDRADYVIPGHVVILDFYADW